MTEYDAVFKKFLKNIKDYDFLLINKAHLQELYVDLLESSISDFEICLKDLNDRDDVLSRFNVDLTPQEIEILALGMTMHWLYPQVMNTDLLRNSLNTKDYTTFSPSNLLDKMTTLFNNTEKRFTSKMNLYSYRHGDIEALTE